MRCPEWWPDWISSVSSRYSPEPSRVAFMALPVTIASYELTEKSGFYKENPGTDVAVTQMIRKTTDKSRGIRLGNFVQIRTIVDEEMEQVWGGRKAPKDALESVVKRGNEQLERFAKTNK